PRRMVRRGSARARITITFLLLPPGLYPGLHPNAPRTCVGHPGLPPNARKTRVGAPGLHPGLAGASRTPHLERNAVHDSENERVELQPARSGLADDTTDRRHVVRLEPAAQRIRHQL